MHHIPKTYLSLHNIASMQVACGHSLEQPLILTIDGEHGSTQITLFLKPYLTSSQIEALAAAMTTVLRPVDPCVAEPCPHETAAYKAADDYWDRLKADLDRRPIEGTRR